MPSLNPASTLRTAGLALVARLALSLLIGLLLIASGTSADEPSAPRQRQSRNPTASARRPAIAEPASFIAPLSEAEAAPLARAVDRGARPSKPSLSLPRRGQRKPSTSALKPIDRPAGTASTLFTGLASLAVVLGLFFVVTWALRRGMPRGAAQLPSDVVEVLGRTPLATRQFAHLIRCGNKLVLVHLAPGSVRSLTEITDPVEVDRLSGICRQAHPRSTTASFRQVFQQFAREKPSDGINVAEAAHE